VCTLWGGKWYLLMFNRNIDPQLSSSIIKWNIFMFYVKNLFRHNFDQVTFWREFKVLLHKLNLKSHDLMTLITKFVQFYTKICWRSHETIKIALCMSWSSKVSCEIFIIMFIKKEIAWSENYVKNLYIADTPTACHRVTMRWTQFMEIIQIGEVNEVLWPDSKDNGNYSIMQCMHMNFVIL
jgi:hypothetical protein